jgi:hypothetical protein
MNKPHRQSEITQHKERILVELQHAMQQHHVRKRRRRRLTAMTMLLAVVTSVLWFMLQPHSTPTPQYAAPEPTPSTMPDSQFAGQTSTTRTTIVTVQTDPTIVQRFAASTTTTTMQRIDDEQLLATLSDLGRPTGLVRVGETVWLTSPDLDHPPAVLQDVRHRSPSSSFALQLALLTTTAGIDPTRQEE